MLTKQQIAKVMEDAVAKSGIVVSGSAKGMEVNPDVLNALAENINNRLLDIADQFNKTFAVIEGTAIKAAFGSKATMTIELSPRANMFERVQRLLNNAVEIALSVSDILPVNSNIEDGSQEKFDFKPAINAGPESDEEGWLPVTDEAEMPDGAILTAMERIAAKEGEEDRVIEKGAYMVLAAVFEDGSIQTVDGLTIGPEEKKLMRFRAEAQKAEEPKDKTKRRKDKKLTMNDMADGVILEVVEEFGDVKPGTHFKVTAVVPEEDSVFAEEIPSDSMATDGNPIPIHQDAFELFKI